MSDPALSLRFLAIPIKCLAFFGDQRFRLSFSWNIYDGSFIADLVPIVKNLFYIAFESP